MKFLAFSNDQLIAEALDEQIEVETIFVDIEILGKKKRQANTNSLISGHSIKDLQKLRPCIKKSKLGIRINPINKSTVKEIENAIQNNVDIIMLPMFSSIKEVNTLLKIVGNRVQVDLLVETPSALQIVDELPLDLIRNIHFGINDLSLAYKLPHMFNIFPSGVINNAYKFLYSNSQVFGIGGLIIGFKTL